MGRSASLLLLVRGPQFPGNLAVRAKTALAVRKEGSSPDSLAGRRPLKSCADLTSLLTQV